jgi:hypothetical protein
MHLADMNGETLSKELQQEVPDEYVIIAKHMVMGLDDEAICEILSCELIDLATAKEDPTFKTVKAMVVNAHANQNLQQTSNWDALENVALEGLMKRVKFEKDPEFLLKVAAVANKAIRKSAPKDSNVLDPMGKGVTRIQLTSRLVQRINQGTAEQIQERELSITDGSMGRASFDEVNQLLDVKPSPVLPKALEISTHQAEPQQDDLLAALLRRADKQ